MQELRVDILEGTLGPTEVASSKKKRGTENPPRRKESAKKYSQRVLHPISLGMMAFRGRSLQWFRNTRAWSFPQLVNFMKSKGALNPAEPVADFATPIDVLQQGIWGGPKLPRVLKEIRDVVLGQDTDLPEDKRKVLMFCQSPKTDEFLLKLLNYIGIPTILLNSAMKPSDRWKAIRNFNTAVFPKVLITTYTLDIAGHDLHHRSATGINVEPAFNQATEHQFNCRLYRIGQTSPIRSSSPSASIFSPSVFSPSIFSLSIFSPFIFSPFIFSPFISPAPIFSPSHRLSIASFSIPSPSIDWAVTTSTGRPLSLKSLRLLPPSK